MLGDSFTEGKIAWRDSYVGRIAAHFPQYDFLNGGVSSYSPSNYFNVARMVLAAGYDIDEVIVFIDISDVQDEATFYQDADASGAVTGPRLSVTPSPGGTKRAGALPGNSCSPTHSCGGWSESWSITATITSRPDPWATRLIWSGRRGLIAR